MSLSAIDRKLMSLEKAMQAAAEAEKFEEASRLLAEIRALRGEAEGRPTARQPPPGQMGLGTHVPVAEPPKGWKPPKKPDPMTANVKSRGGR
jgi:hypothetical protein